MIVIIYVLWNVNGYIIFFLNIYLGIFENIVTLKGIYDNVIVLTAHILHLKIVIASLSIGFNIQ